MLELGIFHNGASDLPKKITSDGVVVNDGTLADTHQSFQRAVIAQVRLAILADRLGFNYWFMTEHHFQPEGPEFSPNPLLVEADEPMYDLSMKVTAELLARKEVLLFGTPDEVGEKILRVKERVGYGDLSFTAWFELGGFTTEETEDQMQHFMEAVAPGLRSACGGQVENPEVSVDLVPRQAVAV